MNAISIIIKFVSYNCHFDDGFVTHFHSNVTKSSPFYRVHNQVLIRNGANFLGKYVIATRLKILSSRLECWHLG